MEYNHLVSKSELITKCIGKKKHHFFPTSHIEVMFSGHVAVRFVCKECNRITTTFFLPEEYNRYKNVIEKHGV